MKKTISILLTIILTLSLAACAAKSPAASGDIGVDSAKALAKKLEQQDVFLLHGPEYARPRGHADDAIAGWYNRRSFSIVCERSYDALSYSRELLDAVKDGFRFLMPYYQYFDRSYRMAD